MWKELKINNKNNVVAALTLSTALALSGIISGAKIERDPTGFITDRVKFSNFNSNRISGNSYFRMYEYRELDPSVNFYGSDHVSILGNTLEHQFQISTFSTWNSYYYGQYNGSTFLYLSVDPATIEVGGVLIASEEE